MVQLSFSLRGALGVRGGGVMENNPHGIVLYMFNAVGDSLGTCMPECRAASSPHMGGQGSIFRVLQLSGR